MNAQGIILIDIMGLGLIILIINLVRTFRLHVGYAIVWLLSVGALMVIISVPPLLSLVTQATGAIFPVSALSLLAFLFIFLVLITLTVQLSALSARQVELIQTLALTELLTKEEKVGNAGLASNQQDDTPSDG
jgi:hypothetical protein